MLEFHILSQENRQLQSCREKETCPHQDHPALRRPEGCPFGRSHPAEAQVPWKEALGGWQSMSTLCSSGGGSRPLPSKTMLRNTDPYSVRSLVTKGVESKGRLSAHRLPGMEEPDPHLCRVDRNRIISLSINMAQLHCWLTGL